MLASDRGFNTKGNDRFLAEENIFNATCPKNPAELKIKMNDDRFRNAQRRRAQTESRIGILKNKFIGLMLFRKAVQTAFHEEYRKIESYRKILDEITLLLDE
ncbi:MAG TPA: hypothetical protein VHO70_00065 [Chitinispirillaceae bacterium]|nr:hypothetical protein [Chitinispirillaceae bacterium]